MHWLKFVCHTFLAHDPIWCVCLALYFGLLVFHLHRMMEIAHWIFVDVLCENIYVKRNSTICKEFWMLFLRTACISTVTALHPYQRKIYRNKCIYKFSTYCFFMSNETLPQQKRDRGRNTYIKNYVCLRKSGTLWCRAALQVYRAVSQLSKSVFNDPDHWFLRWTVGYCT